MSNNPRPVALEPLEQLIIQGDAYLTWVRGLTGLKPPSEGTRLIQAMRDQLSAILVQLRASPERTTNEETDTRQSSAENAARIGISAKSATEKAASVAESLVGDLRKRYVLLERFRQVSYKHIDPSAFQEHFFNLKLPAWDEVRAEFAELERLIADMLRAQQEPPTTTDAPFVGVEPYYARLFGQIKDRHHPEGTGGDMSCLISMIEWLWKRTRTAEAPPRDKE